MTDVDAAPTLDLVGTGEIANRLDLDPVTIRAWRHRNHLPDPEWMIGRAPVWRWETVAACPIVYRHIYERGHANKHANEVGFDRPASEQVLP